MTTSSPKENPCPIRERDGSQPLAHSCCARAVVAEAKLAGVERAHERERKAWDNAAQRAARGQAAAEAREKALRAERDSARAGLRAIPILDTDTDLLAIREAALAGTYCQVALSSRPQEPAR